ncbi:MAG: efflux RND transporter periplasmic adaptor subunit [Micavibrio aeruginosavorus]|nr:efflux RND transporter periplasmic adaptor subunit [Micavibrio aeruginosavorus]
MIKRFIIVGVFAALLLGGLIGFGVFKKVMMGKFFASMVPPPSPVAMVVAKAAPVPRLLEGIGTIEAVRQVIVSPEVGGRVTGIAFEAGNVVTAGDLLVQLNDEPERGDLTRYQAQAQLAQRNLDRSSKLVDVASTRSQVDVYRSQLEEAKGGIERTNAVIAQKKILAPFDGVLGLRQINLGEYLNPGQAIVTLTDLSDLFINFTLPEQNLSQLSVGQKVRIGVDAWPGKTFEAAINAIEPQIGTETRTIKVQAQMYNSEKLLTPGMYAKAVVVLPDGPAKVILPETAVDFTIYGDSVFVVKDKPAEGAQPAGLVAERVYIKTGERFDGRVAVEEGLKDGDRIVTSGQLKLRPGAPVVPAADDKIAADAQIRAANPTNE